MPMEGVPNSPASTKVITGSHIFTAGKLSSAFLRQRFRVLISRNRTFFTLDLAEESKVNFRFSG